LLVLLFKNDTRLAGRIATSAEFLAHCTSGLSDVPAHNHMNLLVRINLVLAVAFALAAFAVGWACSSMLQENAKQETLRQAGLMMDSALSMRAYTSAEIVPLLNEQMQKVFLPQSIPSYAATQNFLHLHEKHPEYAYKEATLNPTNLQDRAMDWESDLIQQFRNDANRTEIVGERDTPTGRSLYLARPIHAEAKCLVCHSVPAAAPVTLIQRYGSNNGFGWQVHEIIGAQVVSVPLATAAVNASRIFHSVMTSIVAILIATLLIVNVVLYYLIVRPVRRMAAIAHEVSLGNMAVGEFPRHGSTEVTDLGRSFDRMRTSLAKALKMLEG
jgi:HAMP domain-containing protein